MSQEGFDLLVSAVPSACERRGACDLSLPAPLGRANTRTQPPAWGGCPGRSPEVPPDPCHSAVIPFGRLPQLARSLGRPCSTSAAIRPPRAPGCLCLAPGTEGAVKNQPGVSHPITGPAELMLGVYIIGIHIKHRHLTEPAHSGCSTAAVPPLRERGCPSEAG